MHAEVAGDPQYADCYDILSCEICNKADAEHLLLQCDTCHKLYHTHCMQLPAAVAAEQKGWSCRHCTRKDSYPCRRRGKRCRAQHEARPELEAHMPQQLIMVRWAPSWEPKTM